MLQTGGAALPLTHAYNIDRAGTEALAVDPMKQKEIATKNVPSSVKMVVTRRLDWRALDWVAKLTFELTMITLRRASHHYCCFALSYFERPIGVDDVLGYEAQGDIERLFGPPESLDQIWM